MQSVKLLIGGLSFLALLPLSTSRAAGESSCADKQAQLERTIALVSKLPGPEQAHRLDAFQHTHDDPERCIVDQLLELENKIERPLIVLRADGTELEPDKINRCVALQKRHELCNGAYADDTLSADERLTAGPSFAAAKRCSFVVRWPGAKLIDLYYLSPTIARRPISPRDGTFDRPPIGTSLVAVYQVAGYTKLRKLVWVVH